MSSGQPRPLRQDPRNHPELGSSDVLRLVVRDSFPMTVIGYPCTGWALTDLSAKLQTQEGNCLPDISHRQGHIYVL